MRPFFIGVLGKVGPAPQGAQREKPWWAGRPHTPAAVGSIPAPASMADELENAIRDSALGPKRASGDSGSIDQHSLKDQIDADKYLAGKTAMSKNPAKGFTRVKIIPPGSV